MLRDGLVGIQDPMALLEGLFAHSPVPYILFKADGSRLASNAAYRAMFQAEPPPEYNLFADEEAARSGIADAVRRAFAGETVHTPTTWYDPKQLEHIHVTDARRVAISCTFFPLRGPGGEVTHVAIAFKDVSVELEAREAVEAERDQLQAALTQQDRLAAALVASEARLRLALEAADLGDWSWHADDDRLELSAQACRIVGLDRRETTWAELQQRLAPDDAARANQEIKAAFAARRGYALDYRVRRVDDGREVWVAARATPVFDSTGRAHGMVGVVLDITERTRVEERQRFLVELAAATQRCTDPADTARVVARQLAEFLGADRCAYAETDGADGFVIIGEHDRGGLGSILGRFPLAAFGAEFTRTCHADEPYVVRDVANDARIEPAIRGAYDAAQIGAVVSMPFHKGGTFAGGMAVHQRTPRAWRHDEIDLLRLVADRCWEAVERARVIRELREREEALREADRRKDEFLATLAHELRNPLAPIRTAVEIVKAAPDTPAAARATLVMERQIKHMVRLIDDLLDVSRVSRGKFDLQRARIAVRTVIEHAVEASQPLVAAGEHQLVVEVPDQPLWIDGDLTRLAQVVSNLLNNAAKYTPPGGRITVTVLDRGEVAEIRVSDTGEGIPPALHGVIFDLFTQVGRTLDRAQGGLGIGLSLVKKLVEMHGGTIQCESPGSERGSTFIVRLPLAEAKAAAAPVLTPAAGMRPLRDRPLQILVVDDNEDAAELLALHFQHDGHATQAVHDGHAALAAARTMRPDVVFLDIGLPGMDGYEVATQLRKEPALESMHLVALTGWGSVEDRQRAIDAGFDDHLTKPVELSAVARVLTRLRS